MIQSKNPRDINPNDFFNLEKNEDRIKFLLQYGVLAPSTHNSQPWLLKVGTDSCRIYYDKTKEVKEADPLGRDLFISFGCFIENVCLAAECLGVATSVEYLDRNEADYIADIKFSNLTGDRTKIKETDLLDIIVTRVNARGIFENKNIPSEVLENLMQLSIDDDIKIFIITDKEKIKTIADLTARGLKAAYSSSKFRKEMSGWMNSNFSQKKEGIPGYSLRMSGFFSLFFPKLVRFLNIGKMVGVLNYKSVSSAPGVVIICSKDNQKTTWLRIGRLAEKLMLYSKKLGLKTSVFVASIEMMDFHKELQKIIGSDLLPQFLFCVGYLNYNQKPNSRFSVEEKLIQ